MDTSNMAGDNATQAIPPPIMWAQRNDKVYLTINVEDVQNPVIKLEETKLFFQGKGGTENKHYELTIEFFKEINPSESKYAVWPRNIPVVVVKKEDGPYWPRLLKENKKQHWLKTDFEKWRDEDDSDAEGPDDSQLEDMMSKLGNFNAGGAGGMGMGGDLAGPPDFGAEEEEDSDDEELPDLE